MLSLIPISNLTDQGLHTENETAKQRGSERMEQLSQGQPELQAKMTDELVETQPMASLCLGKAWESE
jgi:hypothetical protein